ncbi:MAG: exodeoxyribonuclease VII large subunit [Pirellulaceae bacterium]
MNGIDVNMEPGEMEPGEASDPAQEVWSVTELTRRIKGQLESEFPAIWVSGELSDLARPRSGHVYFTLKDADAQVRGVIWKGVASRLSFDLDDGLEVLCHGQIDVYPPRGSYQLIVRKLEPMGLGALQEAFRALHDKLKAEGLFEATHKQSLPSYPGRIAVVTSPTGAAIRDFYEVLRRRWPMAEVLVLPCRVQGAGASQEIATAIEMANRLQPAPDVLVVTRGGGSLEDLWCFNEEPVIRAVFESRLPVVSAVGHEIDVTLCDLVADLRALTPTEAAERIVPAAAEFKARLVTDQQRMSHALKHRLSASRDRLLALSERRVLRRPGERLELLSQQLDDLERRGARALLDCWTRCQDKLRGVSSQLESLSPLGVLSRGYSVTRLEPVGDVVTDATSLGAGQLINTRLGKGTVISRVEETKPNE